ncbi:MAG: energy-coupling factor ABC transporter permease [Sneathiellales bacterium]|nr:energy-coupling factor ABC transporter permease [Sneathiellales bacterium]
MHIEPGIVEGSKIFLSYATAAGAVGYCAKQAWDTLKRQGPLSLLGRSVAATALVFIFFEVLPHYPVGVSEVHFILGSTLFLILGAAPAAIGLALGLLAQGILFAPFDLPQYGMNLTTLLVPLFGLQYLANRLIAPDTAYVDLTYKQTLALSTAYQGGIVAWVAFWAFYGSGFTAETLTSVSTFGAAYIVVLLIEPLADLAVLALAKAARNTINGGMFTPRLYEGA